MITILGAGGVIANEAVKLLSARKQPFRLVARRARVVPAATEMISADLSGKDQTIRAVAGSSVVHLLVGLKYDHKLWSEMWPRIMANTIEACKHAHAKLIFFDNVYMYGKASGAKTEETQFNPCGKKGEVRAKIATSLINECKAGVLIAMIARAADFYGPEKPNGLSNDSVPHSCTYKPDAARSLVTLSESESAWNQTWHVATTTNPPTGKEFIAMAAKELDVALRYRVLSRPMVRLIGWFNPLVGEVYEMLYQNYAPYVFDSSKFARAFSFSGTPYAQGIRATAASFQKVAPSTK